MKLTLLKCLYIVNFVPVDVDGCDRLEVADTVLAT